MGQTAIAVIACRRDNYGFLLHDASSGQTACIDTPDAERILEEADRRGWSITHIWNTHWHDDHIGGNAAIRAATGCLTWGPEEVQARTHVDQVVGDGDTVFLGGQRADILATPGHTLGHIVFYLASAGIAFVGDTLFSGGCGRLFEGSALQMWSSLSRLCALPASTRIYCAHEYTEANMAFAAHIDGGNAHVRAYMRKVRAVRAEHVPTIPTILGEEMHFNPFLRASDPGLQEAMGCVGNPVGTFAELRARKDVF